jgi:hypothetical protein
MLDIGHYGFLLPGLPQKTACPATGDCAIESRICREGVMKRTASPAAPKRLAWFATEQNIPKDSALWPQITAFQRQGFVSLRWTESAAYCFAKLTAKGEIEVKRRQDAGELT